MPLLYTHSNLCLSAALNKKTLQNRAERGYSNFLKSTLSKAPKADLNYWWDLACEVVFDTR